MQQPEKAIAFSGCCAIPHPYFHAAGSGRHIDTTLRFDDVP